MAKGRPSLEAFAQDAEPKGNIVELKAAEAEVVPAKRKAPSHSSLYLDKAVVKAIKEIALQYDRKPHDLYLEGINLMLVKYGRPSIEELSRK